MRGGLAIVVAGVVGTMSSPAGAADDAGEWALWGVVAPASLGVALAVATDPSKQDHVPGWETATLAGLFGTGTLWGTSLGYYRAGQPGYATVSGLGKTALLAGGIALERRVHSPRDDTPPLVTALTLAIVAAWDLWDYFRLDGAGRR
jgi:uncharacterized membrane protein